MVADGWWTDETLRATVARALSEDIGAGDLTSHLLISADHRSTGDFVLREAAVVAGLPVVNEVFRQVDAGLRLAMQAADGDGLAAGSSLAQATGSTRSLLAGERVALNLLQRLSGIATLTAAFVRAVEGTRARIIDTRKTTPGLRLLEKYAVRVGGGYNHRFGLADGILIKDNHLAAIGGVGEAVRRARAGAPHLAGIEVEVETLAQLEEALEAGADVILLDNMPVDELRRAVQLTGRRARLEASGGITLATVRTVAETGVDLISVGALTHSAPAVDIALDVRADR